MEQVQEGVSFRRGRAMPGRLALAPLTNAQSHDDGCLSDDEFNWLVKRAEGGFGMVMTCAATTHISGKAFPRQLGAHDDIHLPGLERLATALRRAGTLSSLQLQHGGRRALADLNGGDIVGPVDDAARGVRGLSTGEVEQAVDDFVQAARRAEKAGFDGVEIHGAHGYLPCQFMDARYNMRTDRYGGTFDGRVRILMEIVSQVRAHTRPDFQIGVRISPERYGLDFGEMRELAARLLSGGQIEYLDISCWDVFKRAEDPAWADRPMLEWFTMLERGDTRLSAAGKLTSAAVVRDCLAMGVDFAFIGRGAILHHDFPRRIAANQEFTSIALPVSRDHLTKEGLGPHFVDYMATWPGFVAPDDHAA